MVNLTPVRICSSRNVSFLFPAFGLPKQASSRLLSCLIPNEPLDGALVRNFVLATLSICGKLDDNHYLLPILRWTNCESADILTIKLHFI